MRMKAVALILVTVGGVGAVLVLNPSDAKQAASHATKLRRAAKPAALPASSLSPEQARERQPERFGHHPHFRPATDGSSLPVQRVAIKHDLSEQWSDDTGWDGQWDDDVPRPRHHIGPSSVGRGIDGPMGVEDDPDGKDSENPEDSGGNR